MHDLSIRHPAHLPLEVLAELLQSRGDTVMRLARSSKDFPSRLVWGEVGNGAYHDDFFATGTVTGAVAITAAGNGRAVGMTTDQEGEAMCVEVAGGKCGGDVFCWR
jgi:hypothetical protein